MVSPDHVVISAHKALRCRVNLSQGRSKSRRSTQ